MNDYFQDPPETDSECHWESESHESEDGTVTTVHVMVYEEQVDEE